MYKNIASSLAVVAAISQTTFAMQLKGADINLLPEAPKRQTNTVLAQTNNNYEPVYMDYTIFNEIPIETLETDGYASGTIYDFQLLMAEEAVTTPVDGHENCEYGASGKEYVPNSTDKYFYSFRMDCPLYDDSVFLLQFEDTSDNWAKTTDSCSNILMNREVDGDKEIRTYAVNGDAGI